MVNDERVIKLEEKVIRLYSIAWVLGTLAGIMGISGIIGYNSLRSANKELSELHVKIKEAKTIIGETRVNEQKEFIEFCKAQKKPFFNQLNDEINRLKIKVERPHSNIEIGPEQYAAESKKGYTNKVVVGIARPEKFNDEWSIYYANLKITRD